MTLRWGIIGCGNVTEVKSGPGFQQASGSELAAVMRRDGALAADYAKRHGVPRWYDDAEALIHDPQVDAVYIATPVGSHLELALRCCAAGKPCYVEKPMTRNHAEAVRMVEAFEQAGVPLFTAYYRRGLARFRNARELVAGGRLGSITSVNYRQMEPGHRTLRRDRLPWRYVAEHAGGGLFLDVGCHTLDILDFIVGPLSHVRGSAANLAQDCDVEDAVSMSFTIGASGAVGTGCWNFAAHAREDQMVIDGTEGRLLLSTFGNDPFELHTAQGVERFDLPNPAHIEQPLIQMIVDDLSGGAKCESTGVSGARTSAVMDAVLSDYYAGRDDAFWLRPQTWPGRRRESQPTGPT